MQKTRWRLPPGLYCMDVFSVSDVVLLYRHLQLPIPWYCWSSSCYDQCATSHRSSTTSTRTSTAACTTGCSRVLTCWGWWTPGWPSYWRLIATSPSADPCTPRGSAPSSEHTATSSLSPSPPSCSVYRDSTRTMTGDRPLRYVNPLMPTVAIWVQVLIKHPVPDRVKPSFVIIDIRAFWRSGLSVRVPGCQKLQVTA